MRRLDLALALLVSASSACAPSASAPRPDAATSQAAPELERPPAPRRVVVHAEAPGLSPIEVERAVLEPIEPALASIAGVTRVESRARSGSATCALTLASGVDPHAVRAAVQSRLQEASSGLPEDVHTVLEADRGPRSERLFFALEPDDPVRATALLRDLRRALVRAPGVVDLELCGERREEARITVDPARLRAHGIAPAALRRALSDALDPHGLGGLGSVRVASRPADPESLGAVVVATVGAPPIAVTLRDLATIAIGVAEPECDAVALSGAPSIVGAVWLSPGADRGEAEARLRAEAASLGALGLTLEVTSAPPLTVHLAALAGQDRPSTVRAAARALNERLGERSRDGARLRGVVDRGGPSIDLELHLFRADASAVDAVEAAIAATPSLRLRHVEGADRPPPIRAQVIGDDLEQARAIAERAAALAATVPGVIGAASRSESAPELELSPDRARLAELGLSVADLAAAFRLAEEGEVVGALGDGAGGSIPVRLSIGAQEGGRLRPEELGDLELALPGGGAVRLGDVAQLRRTEGLVEVERVDLRRAVEVEITVRDPLLREPLTRAFARDLELPAGVVITWE
ncbi:MAG: efflux RND transporter permease subunit [Nannocystaceae bacterium]